MILRYCWPTYSGDCHTAAFGILEDASLKQQEYKSLTRLISVFDTRIWSPRLLPSTRHDDRGMLNLVIIVKIHLKSMTKDILIDYEIQRCDAKNGKAFAHGASHRPLQSQFDSTSPVTLSLMSSIYPQARIFPNPLARPSASLLSSPCASP